MKNTIDLQIQTTASDGKHTSREVVEMAKELGITTIAITDHDTLGGVEEGIRAGEELGVRVISGIEMSVEEYESHVLGFGIDVHNEALNTMLESSRALRLGTLREMMERLKKNEGFVIEWEDVLNDTPDSKTITRLHVVRSIMKKPENQQKLGGITKQEFFKKYFSEKGPNYVHRKYPSVKEVAKLLHDAGGVAVWSHPIIPGFQSRDYEALEKGLREFIGWGIDGVEVFNPSHTEDDAECLEGLSRKYNILRTAGSDFHEKGNHVADSINGLHSARTLGDYEIYGFDTGDIITQLDEAINKKKL